MLPNVIPQFLPGVSTYEVYNRPEFVTGFALAYREETSTVHSQLTIYAGISINHHCTYSREILPVESFFIFFIFFAMLVFGFWG
jgi:hypothetical protein